MAKPFRNPIKLLWLVGTLTEMVLRGWWHLLAFLLRAWWRRITPERPADELWRASELFLRRCYESEERGDSHNAEFWHLMSWGFRIAAEQAERDL
jgi:hypothetical protein